MLLKSYRTKNMSKMKEQILLEMKAVRAVMSGKISICLLLIGIICKTIVYIRQPLLENIEHPIYPIYMMLEIWLVLLLGAAVFGIPFEWKLRRFFQPLDTAIKEFDFEGADYWQYALLFEKAKNMQDGVGELKKKYTFLNLVSRIFLVFSYIAAILCIVMCGRVYADISLKTDILYNLGFTAALAVYLVLILYLLLVWSPVVPYMAGLLFGLLLMLYAINQYTPQLDGFLLSMGINAFWNLKLDQIQEALSSVLLILSGVFLYTLCFNMRGKLGGAWNKIEYYEKFAYTYCGFAKILHETEQDNEAVEYLEELYRGESKSRICYKKAEQLRERSQSLLDYLAVFSEKMLVQFSPVFDCIPDWGIALVEYDLENE